MTDQTDIYNMVTDMLDEAARINSPTDDSPIARRIHRNYENVRDMLLETHHWNFARRRKSINKMTVDPAFGWLYQYALPDDFIAMSPIQKNGTFEGESIPYEIESYVDSNGKAYRVIVTDQVTPIKVIYTRKVTNTAHFSPLFTRALAAQLALYVCYAVTRKRSYTDVIKGILNDAMRAARASDNMQGTMARPDDSAWISARQTEYNG